MPMTPNPDSIVLIGSDQETIDLRDDTLSASATVRFLRIIARIDTDDRFASLLLVASQTIEEKEEALVA
jgi:hypothetical protein